MLSADRLETILIDVWAVLTSENLSWIDLALLWDTLGEVIFSEGGKLKNREAVARMFLYLDDRRRQEGIGHLISFDHPTRNNSS